MDRLFNIGITEGMPAYLKSTIKLTNQLAVILFIVGLVYGLLTISFQAITILALTGMILCLVVLVLNYRKYYNASRILIALMPPIDLSLIHANIVQEGDPIITSLSIGYIAISIVPFLIFDIRETRLWLPVIIVVWSVFMFQELTNQWVQTPMDSSIFYEPFMEAATNLINICIITFGLIFYQLTKVSERTKEIKKREERLSVIYNSTKDPTGLVAVDQEGSYTVESINSAFLKQMDKLGISINKDELKSMSLVQFWQTLLKFPDDEINKRLAIFDKVRDSRQVIDYQYSSKYSQMGEVFLESTLTPILDEAGNCKNILFATRDITEKLKAEKALKESEQRLSLIYNSTDLQIGLVKVLGKEKFIFESFNQPALIFLNALNSSVSEKDIIEMDVLDHYRFNLKYPEEKIKDRLEKLKRVVEQKEILEYEYSLERRHGKEVFFRARKLPILDTNGACSHILYITEDITNRVETERALERNQKQLSLIYNNTQTIMVLVRWEGDDRFILESMNDPSWRFLNSGGTKFSKTDILEKDVPYFFSHVLGYDDQLVEERLKLFQNIVKHKKSVSYDGQASIHGDKAIQFLFNNTVTPIMDLEGNCTHILWSIQDITERVKASQALKSTSDQLSLIYHGTIDFIALFRYDEKNNFIVESLNEPMWEWLQKLHPNLQTEDLIEKDLDNYYSKVYDFPESRIEGRKQYFNTVVKARKSISFKGSPKSLPDTATQEYYLSTLTPIVDSHGKATHVLAVVRNITEQKSTEILLKRSGEEIQKQLRLNQLILETTLDGYILVDDKANIVDVNPAYCELSGYKKEELVKKNIGEIEQTMSPEEVAQQVQHVVQNKGARFESKHLKKDGTILEVDNNLSLVQFEGKSMVAGFIRDITAEKQARKELEYRLEFENLLTKISSEFINLPLKDLETGINYALKQLAEFIGFDRSGIVLLNQKKNTGSIRYEWCKPGVQALKNHYQDVPNDTFPWLHNRLEKRKLLMLKSRNELPEEAGKLKGELQQLAIQSLIHVPLFWQGMLTGFIGFDAREDRQSLPKDLDVLLRFAGEMFANVLQRKKGELLLKASEQQLSMIYNSNLDYICLLKVHDDKRFTIETVNQSIVNFFDRAFGSNHDHKIVGLEATFMLEHYFGLTKENTLGRVNMAKQVVDTQESISFQDKLISPIDGGDLYFETILSPIIENNRCVEVLCVIREVTEKEKSKEALTESEKRMTSVFNGTKDLMAIFNIEKNGAIKLEQINQAFKFAWQIIDPELNLDNFIGKSSDEFNSGVLQATKKEIEDRKKVLKQVIKTQKAINLEEEFFAANNKKYYVDITVAPILSDSGKCEKVLLTARDISFKKRANERLISKILETEDRERKRISKELHDSLGQNLTTASLNLNYLKTAIAQVDDTYKVKFQSGIKFLNNAINESRNIAHNLMPQSIVDFGYVMTIESLIQDMNEASETQFVFYHNLNEKRLAPYQELSLFRITQEAINNIIKHAHAKKATVQLMKYPDAIILTIEDNGKGFDPEQINGQSFGLNSMKTRVSALSGSLLIDSSTEQGASLTIEIPI